MSGISFYKRVAESLDTQAQNGEPVHLPADAGIYSDEAAYLVQAESARLRHSRKDVRTGYKIACTTPAAQQAVARSAPAFAPIFEGGDITDTGSIEARANYPLGVECELAVVIGNDVSVKDDVIAAVSQIAIGCEIVEDRYGGIGKAGSECLIADGFAHRAYAIGPLLKFDAGTFDVNELRASIRSSQTLLADGRISSGMANPLEALKWLHLMLAERDLKLQAGDIVLTGAIAPPLWLERPCALSLQLYPLGQLELTVGPAIEESPK